MASLGLRHRKDVIAVKEGRRERCSLSMMTNEMFDLRLRYIHQKGRSKGEGDKAGPDGSRVLHQKEMHLQTRYTLTRSASMVQIPGIGRTRLLK